MEIIKLKLLIVSLILNLSFLSNAALLEGGSTVPVKLAQNVNANMDSTGQTIYFKITEDVFVDELLVLKEGELIKGFISEAVGRKSMGKGGQLTLTPKSMKTSNKQLVKFEQNPLSSEGRKRTGATVAHVVMWGPLGLFAKGRAAFIMRGTEFDLTVEDDVELKPYKNTSSKNSARENINAVFKEYSKKINFRKGKIGKDFILYIPANELSNESLKTNNDVKISSVNDDLLPKPIKSKALLFDSKKNRYEVSFDFRQIVSYINPGSSEIVIDIGENLKAETSLTTRWKIK